MGLLLLAMLFFMLTFRGKAPPVLDRVFAAQSATEPAIAERRQVTAGMLDGAYHDPADRAPFTQTPGYTRLLRMLTDHVRPGDIVADPPLFDRNLAMVYPELQRGETVKVRGIVAAYWAEILDNPVFELHDVWRVFLTDGDGEDGIVIDVMNRPPAFEQQRDLVEVTGVFYRLVTYESEGGKVREIPYLLARSLVVVPDAPRESPFNSSSLVIVLIGLSAMVIWGIVRVIKARPRPQGIRWRAPHIN